METIIITGATSFIGIHLLKKMLTLNIKVYVVVRPKSKNIHRVEEYQKFENMNLILLDMKDILHISEYIKDKVDCIYHLAWEGTRLPYRDDQKIQKENYNQTVELFQAAVQLGVRKFIVTGSQAEYGKMHGKLDEEFQCNPETQYGKYKLAAYYTLKKIAEEENICLIWARIFSVYGIYDSPNSLVMSCIHKMQRNEKMDLTECKQNWDYLNVNDLVEVLNRFGKLNCRGGIYNVASGISKPLFEYVETIKKVLGSSSNLGFGNICNSSEGSINMEPNVEKIKKELKWNASTPFDQGILEISTILKNNV